MISESTAGRPESRSVRPGDSVPDIAELRRAVRRSSGMNQTEYWVVSSYDLLGEINRNPSGVLQLGRAGGSRHKREAGAADPLGDRMLIQMDPPEHTAYRRAGQRLVHPESGQGEGTEGPCT